jgi:spermidine synthase
VLDSAEFYADCRRLLTDDGVMTVNLFGRSSSFQSSLEKIAQAFGEDAVWAFKPTREGNTIVLAQRTATKPKRDQLLARAEVIQTKWGLPATKWLRVFKPML